MKPGIPWSVKGIEPEAREAAKLAARKAGLTLGEWLNSVIFDQSAHVVGSQPESRPLESLASSPNRSPDLSRPDFSSRALAAGVDHKDDADLRLQDIARQLADLAQRERHSAPPPAPERGRADREEFERIVERLDVTERQTVEALTAVNERLTLLSRQISQYGRLSAPERPEDVPGYPALESAIRSVVEHIEVSERRTRDSLRSLQDRLAGMAERGHAPDGEEVMRAVPGLSGLEARLADMVNRIQRSEGLMTERIESVRSTAQQMANQAQAAAVTALRGELREVETRMLSSLKEAQAAATNAPSVMASEIARLHGDMAGLTRRLDEVKAGAASEHEMHALRSAIEQLSARVAQGPDLRPLADVDKRLGDITRRLEQVAAASREQPQLSALEQRIVELDHRLAEAMRLNGDPQSLRHLKDSIAAVNARVDQTEAQLGRLDTMQQAIRQLHDSFTQPRGTVTGPSPELQALEEGLRAVRESSAAAERRHQDTFAAVHETLARIVGKLTELEAAPRAASTQDTAAVELDTVPPSMEGSGTQVPLSGGDDFIAAARRAAQAASAQPPAPGVELAQPAERRTAMPTLLQRLRGHRSDAMPAAEPATPKNTRRTLILTGLVLLVAASVFAYRSISVPSGPVVQQARDIDVPARPAAPSVASSKGGLQVEPRDPIVTGSIMPRPSATKLAMLPPEIGADSLRSAAADGDPRAQFIIAGRYLDGQVVAQDFTKALSWYRQAALRGLAPAQYRLATLYELGKGTATDPKQALVWYERAALGGNVKAMHNAAVLLAGDKAGPADFDRAFRWFKAAAERGFADSQFNLAILYERGLGTPPSAEEAYVWYSLSARQGDSDSRQRAAAIAAQLPVASRKAADLRLASWSATPPDADGNVVKVTDPAWNEARPASVRRSS